MSRSFVTLITGAVAFVLLTGTRAAEITGTINEVTGTTATVTIAGGSSPASGDTAEIFFKLAGADDEISVGNGTVVSTKGELVTIKIESTTGDVAKDQLVRFTPGKGPRPPGPALTPSTQLPPPSVGPSVRPSASSSGGYIGVQIGVNPTGNSGVLVFEALPGGPAARGGIVPNDLIVAVDGSPVNDPPHLSELTAQLAPGTQHSFLVSREGKLQKIDLTVEPRPADLTSAAPAPSPEETLESATTTLPPSVPFPSTPSSTQSKVTPPNEKSDETAAASYVNKGIAQCSAGNMDGAIASYTSGIRVAPSVAILYLNRANAYLYKPNFNAAIADANKAIELKVAKADDAYIIRGTAKAGLGDYDSAVADCNRAIKINPGNALAYNNRANNKIRKRDYKGALSDCNKSISLDSSSALPYYNRGFVYYNLGNASSALSDWKKAVAKQPSFGAELNPKIAQLEAQGTQARPAPPPPQTSTNPAPGPGDWVDLTNAAQKMVGTWTCRGTRTHFAADGTFVSNPYRGQWQVQGDRLVQYFPQTNQTLANQILSISSKSFVLRIPDGQTLRFTKTK